VQAFNPQDAYKLASLILKQVKRLTNELSEQARIDTMYYAQEELDLAENRLLEARSKIKLFRDATNSVDLSASAMAQIELLASLEKELIGIKARIEVLKESLDVDAPSIKALERKAEALEFQISEKSGGLKITGYSEKMSALLADQEKLIAEKTFAETAYASALNSLESARMEASRNQRYLAIYSHPSLPEYPIFPKRILNTFYLFLGLIVFWSIVFLVALAIKDHMMSGWIDEEIAHKSSFKRKLNKLLKNPYAFFSDSKWPVIGVLKNVFKKK
jgi:capsular polysaccharide transport system permease protein